MAKKIPDNITCLSYDEVAEEYDPNRLHWFRCGDCHIIFGVHPEVFFPNNCPNCSAHFVWVEREARFRGSKN